MLVEKAQALLEEFYNNPRLAVKFSLGAGCERVAYKLDEKHAVKIGKDAMYNKEALKECMGEDAKLDLYSGHLRDYSCECQTERELELFKSLSEKESRIFNPILDVGEFNGTIFTIAPLVTIAKDLDCYDMEDLVETLEMEYDYDTLKDVSDRFSLDYYDLTQNSGNFGINSNGDIVIIDYGLEEF